MHRTLTALTAALAFALVVGACSSKPVSQASEQTAPPSSAATPADATTGPSSEPTAEPAATPTPEAAATPNATPKPTPGTPPKPGNPTWTLLTQAPVKATGRILETYRVTWTAPDGVADEFLVYGVKGCLRDAKKFHGKPCVVKGMPIPKDRLVQLASTPGDAREAQVTFEIGEVGPGPYGTILIRAVNQTDRSIFTIVHSDDVCWRCTY
jgi:hypothetical protein